MNRVRSSATGCSFRSPGPLGPRDRDRGVSATGDLRDRLAGWLVRFAAGRAGLRAGSRRPCGAAPALRAGFAFAAASRPAGRAAARGAGASASAIRPGISDGMRATGTPAASKAAIFSAAVPVPPEMIAPACPMRLPGGRGLPGDERHHRLLHAAPG